MACRRLVLLYLFCFWAFTVWAQDTAAPVRKFVFTEQNPDLFELNAFGGVSLFRGVSDEGFTESLVKGGTAGGRASWNFSKYFSLEGNYNFAVNNARLGGSASTTRLFQGAFGDQIQSASLNPVYHFTKRGWKVRPYVTAGVGASWFLPTKKAQAQYPLLEKSSEVALNYGGGLKYHLTPHLGFRLDARGVFQRNPLFGLMSAPSVYFSGLQATAGLVFYLGQAKGEATAVVAPAPALKLQPLNPGALSGASGQLCQGRVLTLHATATDPLGHALSYQWKVNGTAVGTNDPDLSYKPNNAGDFEFEVYVADRSDPARIVRLGPKTLAVQDYALPQISGVTASPNTVTVGGEGATNQSVILAADVVTTPCNGNMSYQWTVSEGNLTKTAGPSAVFDPASLNFDSGLGQTKTITATVTATDEAGHSASQTTKFVVDFPAQYKRLADVIFAKNSARVNNCGKRILIEQAAPQAGTAFDVLLVGHRSADELESVPSSGRTLHSSTLDRQRALSVAAVLTGDHGVCGNLDISQVRICAAGTEQISPADEGFCGTSTIPQTAERRGAEVSEEDKERRVEVYLVPKGSAVLPPAARNATVVLGGNVRALGCPK